MISKSKCAEGPEEIKILIVDDTPQNIDVLRKTLELDGYKIFAANNGQLAIKITSRLVPDVIILDIQMPEMDGFETCRKIKEDPLLNNVPVIFISGKMGREDIALGYQCGGADYIIKPFHQEEVLARVKTHLKLKILTEERTALIEQVQKANKKLEESAKGDPLIKFTATGP